MADDVRLLKTHRNFVLLLIQEAHLDPIEFGWEEVETRDGTRMGYGDTFLMSVLTHTPTGFSYRFGPFNDTYSPGSQTRTDSREHSVHWDYRFTLIREWLSFLKREYKARDLWQMLLEESKLSRVAASPQMPNDFFTTEERGYIREQLGVIKEQIVTDHRLQLRQAEIIEERFNYLAEGLERFGKKDWLNLALGTLLAVASSAIFPPEVAQDMFHRFMAAVQPLFESIMKLISVMQ